MRRGILLASLLLLVSPLMFTAGAADPPPNSPPRSTLAEWEERWALRGTHLGTEAAEARALDLVGANFPIASFPDATSVMEGLASSSAAYNPVRNEYLVAWHASTQATAANIHARRFSASGSPLGGEFVISAAAGPQVVPNVAYNDATDQYWVTWTDYRSGPSPDVYLRRLSANGSPLGGEMVVNEGAPSAFASRVACGGGRCAVVWASDPDDGNSHILIKGYNADGSPLTGVLLLSGHPGVATEPDICFNAEDGHFAAVWYEWHSGTDWDIGAYGLDSLLRKSFGRISISSSSGNQVYPRVAYSAGADRYCVVWQDGRSQQTWDIYGQLLARSGQFASSALPIFSGPFHDEAPAVAGHGSGSQFMVAYERDILGSGYDQIFASTVTGGAAISGSFAVRNAYNTRAGAAIVHASGSNEYFVTLTDHYAQTQPDILAQRVRSDGTVVGSLIVVSQGRKGQEVPGVAFNSSRNEYLVVWQDYRSGSDYDVYGRRVSATGALMGQELIIASQGALNGEPKVAHNSRSDEYLVVWQEIRSATSGYDIYAQRVGGGGDLRGSAIFISRNTATINEGRAVVAYNPIVDEYLVVWHAFTDGQWRIWGQRVSAAGQLPGSNYLISASSGNTQTPRIAHNSQRNEYLVVWQDSRTAERTDIYGQRLNGVGSPIGGNFPVSTASGNKGRCDVAYSDFDDRYLVVWGHFLSGGSSDIYGQLLNGSAGLVGGRFDVAADDIEQLAPVAAYDGLGREFLVAWWEFYDATDYDIYERRVSTAGSPVGSKFGVAAANEVQSRAELAPNVHNGELLLVWQDFRGLTYDIYGQRWIGSAVVPPTATPTRTSIPTPTRTRIPGGHRVFLPLVVKN
jgi:hypothetical protein